MGSNASQRGDLSQHVTPLPTPAILPGDSPITPTPEQVNRQDCSRTRGSRKVLEMARSIMETPLSSQQHIDVYCSSYVLDKAQKGKCTNSESHSSSESAGIQVPVSLTPGVQSSITVIFQSLPSTESSVQHHGEEMASRQVFPSTWASPLICVLIGSHSFI